MVGQPALQGVINLNAIGSIPNPPVVGGNPGDDLLRLGYARNWGIKAVIDGQITPVVKLKQFLTAVAGHNNRVAGQAEIFDHTDDTAPVRLGVNRVGVMVF